ncbi:hypothetical protein NJ7G_2255 [Natrinema sp. J7-2]|nr:hypothetical protein NJ7G_2255 [Natrinema sp. J7-2]
MPIAWVGRRQIERREIAIVTTCSLSIISAPIVALLWIIVFDSTGFDQLVFESAFTTIGPALTVALFSGLVGMFLYDVNRSVWIGGVVFLASTAFLRGARATMETCAAC